MNEINDSSSSPERRAFFRVMDAVGLDIVKLTPPDAADAANDAFSAAASSAPPVSGDARLNNKYEIEGFAEVKRDFPAVADYINSLEEQIRTLQLGGNEAAGRPTHRVSLSASGIAFADKHLLQPGDPIRMRLTLFPEVVSIECLGTVVNVGVETEIASGELHTYRVAFSEMDASSLKILEAHVENLRRTVRQPAGVNV